MSSDRKFNLVGWFLKALLVIAVMGFIAGAVIFSLAVAYRFAPAILIVIVLVWLCAWADKRAPQEPSGPPQDP